MKHYRWVVVLLLLPGCTNNTFTLDLSNWNSGETPNITPTVQYADWQHIQTGVDFKQMLVGEGVTAELFDIVRIDQTQAKLAIAMNETQPETISAWADTLDASVVVNGSYFDEQYKILTRTVVDGESKGKLLSGATGVAQQAANQTWSITQWTGDSLSSANAVQSYPLLLNAGVPFTGGSVDTAQRSVLAEAKDGTLYIIVTEYGALSLDQLATVLSADLDLDLDYALNLDGGTSTGLAISGPTINYLDDSLVVPSVLYILP